MKNAFFLFSFLSKSLYGMLQVDANVICKESYLVDNFMAMKPLKPRVALYATIQVMILGTQVLAK